jgi:hypothetical protein
VVFLAVTSPPGMRMRRPKSPCYYSCVTTRAIMFLPIQLSGPMPEPIGSYRGVDTRHAIPEDGLVLTA